MPTSGVSVWSPGGRQLPSNQPDAALEREKGIRPFRHHDDAIAEADQPEDVEEDPEQPREETRHFQTEDLADGRPSTDGGHRPVVLVAKRLELTPLNGAQDVACGVRSLLHRDLRHARQRLSILAEPPRAP